MGAQSALPLPWLCTDGPASPCARPTAFQGQWPSGNFFLVPGGEERDGRTFNPKEAMLVEPVD